MCYKLLPFFPGIVWLLTTHCLREKAGQSLKWGVHSLCFPLDTDACQNRMGTVGSGTNAVVPNLLSGYPDATSMPLGEEVRRTDSEGKRVGKRLVVLTKYLTQGPFSFMYCLSFCISSTILFFFLKEANIGSTVELQMRTKPERLPIAASWQCLHPKL